MLRPLRRARSAWASATSSRPRTSSRASTSRSAVSCMTRGCRARNITGGNLLVCGERRSFVFSVRNSPYIRARRFHEHGTTEPWLRRDSYWRASEPKEWRSGQARSARLQGSNVVRVDQTCPRTTGMTRTNRLQTPGRPTRNLQDSDRHVLESGIVVAHARIIRSWRQGLPRTKLADRTDAPQMSQRTDALQLRRSRCVRVPLALIQTTHALLPPG
jgi:hypothetical protein